jgi:hypothetical protein
MNAPAGPNACCAIIEARASAAAWYAGSAMTRSVAATVAAIVAAIQGETKTAVEANKCGRVRAMPCARPARLGSLSSCSRNRSAFKVRQKHPWFRPSTVFNGNGLALISDADMRGQANFGAAQPWSNRQRSI